MEDLLLRSRTGKKARRLLRGRACNVIACFATFLPFGFAKLQSGKLLAYFCRFPMQPPKNHDGYMLLAACLLNGDMMTAVSGNSARSVHFSLPKRELSPLRRACLSLGLPVDARPRTNLARRLRTLVGLRTAAIIEYLKFSEDRRVRRIVEMYCVLNATERKAVTIDYLIMAADADVHHVSGVIQEGLSRATESQTMLLACLNAPEMARKTIERAMTPEGFRDRQMLLRIAGVFPVTPPGH